MRRLFRCGPFACALLAIVVVAVGCSAEQGTAKPEGSAASGGHPAPLALIIDASGSMLTADAPGPRIDAAKKAATGLIDQLPDGTSFALLTYGTGTGSTDAEKYAGCRDVTVPVPSAPIARASAAAQVARLTPSGYTPIGLSLQQAAAQLPSNGNPQTIVIVSDGEDTCGQPPCDVASQLKRERPGLTISAVGFKTDDSASQALACIANATGGLFVTADNAGQLAARLLATRDVEAAQSALTGGSLGSIQLGMTMGEIRAKNPDFPAASADRTVIVWRDCAYTFVDGKLDSIAPHDGGRTIDGVTVGTPVARATDLYGVPVSATTNADSTTTLLYPADVSLGNGYRITARDYAAGTSGTVTRIVLCRCLPHEARRPAGVTDDAILNMTIPAGACISGKIGWKSTAPIVLHDGKGESTTASGAFGGASILSTKVYGWTDLNGDGVAEAVIGASCTGFQFADCCAGRSSIATMVMVFDFASGSPVQVGPTIVPGSSPIKGETYTEIRRINSVRIDGTSIITDEKLIYGDSVTQEQLGYSPDATIEVTHVLRGGTWTSTEVVLN